MYKVPSVFRRPSTFLHCGSLIEASGREAWGRLEKVGGGSTRLSRGRGGGMGWGSTRRRQAPTSITIHLNNIERATFHGQTTDKVPDFFRPPAGHRSHAK